MNIVVLILILLLFGLGVLYIGYRLGGWRILIPNIFLFFAILCVGSAIALLSYGKHNASSSGSQVAFLLDVSKSMNAYDYGSKSRLDIAKEFIQYYVMKHPEHKYALSIFAGDAVGVIPFTGDRDLFLTFLENVTSESIFHQGSDFVVGIYDVVERFLPGEGGGVFILSDFEPTDTSGNLETDKKSDMISTIRYKKGQLKQRDIYWYGVGIGKNEGSRIIERKNVFGDIIYLSDRFGNEVITRFDTEFFNQIVGALEAQKTTITSQKDFGKIDFSYLPELDFDVESYSGGGYWSWILGVVGSVWFFVYIVVFYYFDRRGKKT